MSREADVTRRKKGRKPGPKAGGMPVKGPNSGEGRFIQMKLDPELFPHIRELLTTKNPVELERRFGITLERDLPWPAGDKKTQSVRAGAILESIARQGINKEIKDAKN